MAERNSHFTDRLLAETTRAWEQTLEHPLREPEADAAGRAAGGDLERRIIQRARSLSVADRLRGAIRHVRAATTWVVAGGVVLSLLAGAGAARAALGAPSDEPVNFFWVLAGLLGVQTLLLVVWLLIMLVRPGAVNVSPIGSLAVAAGRWIASRGPQTEHRAALQATGVVLSHGPIARWTMSTISHLAWTAFNGGCLVLVLLLLSAKHYTFGWETTILDESAYGPLTRAIAAVPEAVGFTAPTPEEVRASQWTGAQPPPESARRAWSSLLVGALVCYGLAPRFVLLLFSTWKRRRALARFRLDVAQPGYVRLTRALMPPAEARGVVTVPGDGTEPSPPAAPAHEGGAGPPVLVGYEIEPPASHWPPRVHGLRWTDLGFVDGREDMHRVEGELAALAERPRVAVVVCSLAATPDRGTRAFLDALAAAAGAPLALVLTDGDRTRRRGDQVLAEHVDVWRGIAGGAGLAPESVLEVDLDHATDASLGRLAALVGAPSGDEAGRSASAATSARRQASRIGEAFAAIRAAADAGELSGDHAQLAEAHRRVAKLYRDDAGGWRARLRLPERLPDDVGTFVRDGARGLVDRLPGALRRSPKWLAAGALAGACGCVAAATLVAPIAISALPAWSALGAGIAGALQLGREARPRDEDGDDEAAGTTTADALRAVTLFALLLDLQGRDEAAISAVLAETLDEDELAPPPDDAAGSGAWLDEVRHRYGMALARLDTRGTNDMGAPS